MDADRPPKALSYATAVPAPVSAEQLLRSARRWLIAGVFLPLFATGTVICSVLARRRTEPQSPNRLRANRWLAGGIAVTVLTPTLYLITFAVLVLYVERMVSQIHCSSTLRQIGLAIQMYSDDNGGAFPPDFHAIASTQDITPEAFICPSPDCADKLPANYVRPIAPQSQPLIVQSTSTCSYFLIQPSNGQLKGLDRDKVIAFEKLRNHPHGMNVLIADGSVEWLDHTLSQAVLAELAAGVNPPPSLP